MRQRSPAATGRPQWKQEVAGSLSAEEAKVSLCSTLLRLPASLPCHFRVFKLVQTLDQLEEGARIIGCAGPDGLHLPALEFASESYDFTLRGPEIRGQLDPGSIQFDSSGGPEVSVAGDQACNLVISSDFAVRQI